MKRILSLLLAAVMLVGCTVFLAGCSDKKDNNYPITYDGVTIEKEPSAIVVLSDCAADIISYIGYDIKMVGRSYECDQSFLKVVPTVGSAASPDVTSITVAGADLVIADNTLSATAREALNASNIPVVTFNRATDMNSLKELYTNLGIVLGGNVTGRKKGEDSYDDLFELLDQFKTATTGVIKTAAYLYLDQNGSLCTFVKGSLEQKIFNYNGAMNIFSKQETAAVDAAQLRLGKPLCIFYDNESVLEYLRYDEQLMNLSALNNGRTLMLPLKSFYRQGKSYEQNVYDMIAFLNKQDEATKDEATPDESNTDNDSSDDSGSDADDEYVYDDYSDDEYVYSDDGSGNY